jgi:hypothetical protein
VDDILPWQLVRHSCTTENKPLLFRIIDNQPIVIFGINDDRELDGIHVVARNQMRNEVEVLSPKGMHIIRNCRENLLGTPLIVL